MRTPIARRLATRLALGSFVLLASCPVFSAGPADVDTQRILAADHEPGNWMAWGRTYEDQRFSPLAEINDINVGRLGLAWYYDLGTRRGVEATPLVVDGVMYNTSAWNVTMALDAKTGAELWRYDPEVPTPWGRYACCDVVSRGLAVWKGKVIIATLDGRLIALDAGTGKPIWTTQTLDPDWPYSITGAPRVYNGKVIIGNAGADYGVRGYVTAYDVETGTQLWRFYTVPGDPAKGFESPAMEMAAGTWTGTWWTLGGGGTVWDSIVYDPDFNRVYIGTGNGSPWAWAHRSPEGGDNLFLASIVALDADTGEYVWHYQQVPGETWDFTATQQMMLMDMRIDGAMRKVLMQAPKNGFFYILDRATGKVISAEEFAPVTWASHVDLKTGRPVENPAARFELNPKLVTPTGIGAHNWHPMSYSPLTGLVYIPVQEGWSSMAVDRDFKPERFRWNTGTGFGALPEGFEAPPRLANNGWLTAWDPVRQREVWRVVHGKEANGGALATAGNLVAQGTADGEFVIYRATDGVKLWSMPVQTAPIAGPISYAVDGEQYIAVNVGWGGGAAMVSRQGEGGIVRSPGRMLAFKLGGTAKLPPLPAREPIPPPPPLLASEDTIRQGAQHYERTCAHCHGPNAIGGGVIPDLRQMSAATHEAFADIVLKGTRAAQGMAGFANELSAGDVEAIHAFLISRAVEDWGR